MENDEEPIDLMARTIYTLLFEDDLTTTMHSWDQLSEATRHKFCVAAARGHQAYWNQRERLQNKS